MIATLPAPAWSANVEAIPAAEELGLVRRVAALDVGLGRILDGHLNAVERLRVQVDPAVAGPELEAVAAGERRLGVWGADPGPGEGTPAWRDGDTLRGVKTFCSGAGELDRAFVLVAGELVLVDLAGVEVDTTWWAGAAMRSSASHRVVFAGQPVLWCGAGALTEQPWFSRDALRTAASWVGGLDAAIDGALDVLRTKGADGDLEALAAGRLLTARGTADAWLERVARAMDAGEDLRALAVHARDAISQTIAGALDEAARACGSRPFATGSRLAQARLDLETYVLQHRLDPIVARAGRAALS